MCLRVLLEEFAEGEDELGVSVVSYGGGEGDDAEGGFGNDAEVDVLAGDGGEAGGVHLAGFVGYAEIDALAEGVGELGDAAEECWFEEEVVGATVLVDGAGGEAEWAAESEAEGLGDVSIEGCAGFGDEDEEVFSDLVGE